MRSGAVEVLDVSGGSSSVVAVHGPGELTGDIAHVAWRASPVRLVARGETDLLAIRAEGLQEMELSTGR